MSDKSEKTIRPTREMRRARLRRAYDHLSRRWRQDRRSQKSLIDLGLEVPGRLLGRKPPFSVFADCIPEGEDPMRVVQESPPVEFLEYAHMSMYRWSGDVPVYSRDQIPVLGENVTTVDLDGNPFESDSERGVATIDIAGGEED